MSAKRLEAMFDAAARAPRRMTALDKIVSRARAAADRRARLVLAYRYSRRSPFRMPASADLFGIRR
jgi:hypothetical protein